MASAATVSVVEEAKTVKKKPRSVTDFINEVKPLIRFSEMNVHFLLKEVADTGVLSVMEEYVLMRHNVVPAIAMDLPMPPTNEDIQCGKDKEDGKSGKKDAETDETGAKKLPELGIAIGLGARKGVVSFDTAKTFPRGTTYAGSWGYASSQDAVRISVDITGCTLVGLGLMCGTGVTNASVLIYIPDNDDSGLIMHMEPMQEFTHDRQQTEPVPFVFASPFELDPGGTYCIELHQTNASGSNSLEVQSAKQTVRVRDSFTERTATLTITSASLSPNGTNETHGAFPCFYICF
jgi:hypothetical protein